MELKRRLSELGTCRGPHFQNLMIFDGLEGGFFYGQCVEIGWW